MIGTQPVPERSRPVAPLLAPPIRATGSSSGRRSFVLSRSSESRSTVPPTVPTLSVAALVCGDVTGASQIASTLRHLRETLVRVLSESPEPYGTAKEVHPLFGPFLTRSILEVACTALLARFDPFRILTLAQLQSTANYEVGKRLTAAIQWQGDVVSEVKSDRWKAELKPEQMSRALLGDYAETISWRPAFERFLDLASGRSHPRVAELQARSLDEFLPRIRALAQKTYSAASKGVHHEFVLPLASYYDVATLRDLFDDAVRVVTDLSVVANCCAHIVFPLSPSEAMNRFEELP